MKKFFVGVVVAVGVVGVLWAAFYPITNNKVVIGYNKGYEPTQPIAFSHKIHATTNQIDCRYCHTSTESSRHASVPSLNVCMNCHIQVRTDSPEIQKLAEAYKTGKSVAWQKVHLLPDHVKFNHAMHIKKGKQCTDCHGNVAEMEKIKQVESLSMGWCVNCHRLPENQAPTNCSTCHY